MNSIDVMTAHINAETDDAGSVHEDAPGCFVATFTKRDGTQDVVLTRPDYTSPRLMLLGEVETPAEAYDLALKASMKLIPFEALSAKDCTMALLVEPGFNGWTILFEYSNEPNVYSHARVAFVKKAVR